MPRYSVNSLCLCNSPGSHLHFDIQNVRRNSQFAADHNNRHGWSGSACVMDPHSSSASVSKLQRGIVRLPGRSCCAAHAAQLPSWPVRLPLDLCSLPRSLSLTLSLPPPPSTPAPRPPRSLMAAVHGSVRGGRGGVWALCLLPRGPPQLPSDQRPDLHHVSESRDRKAPAPASAPAENGFVAVCWCWVALVLEQRH